MPNKKKANTTKEKKVNHNKKKSVRKKVVLALQLIALFTLLTVAIGIFYFYFTYGKTILELQSEAKQKVSASTEETFRSSQTSLVYDSQGNLISTLKAEKDVYYIKYEEIPNSVIDAMVVSEDRNFFQHDGVDYWANVRAAIELMKHKGEITQGASTITQQLARSVFLTQDVTYERKIEEIFAAQEIEKKYEKADIMEYYLNGIYFANGHYGIQAAAQGYFNEGVSALSLSQLVFLCAIPNRPNLYNPVTNMENTLKRRDRILLQMYEAEKIDEAEYQEALKELIILDMDKADKNNYVETYVYHSAIRALMKAHGFEFRYQFDDEEDETAYQEEYEELYYSYQKALYSKGYRIYTSIDLEKQELLQMSVDNTLKNFIEMNEEGVYQMQGAAVCIDNDTGRVVAIVGGRDQDLTGYTLNRAYQSYRQPGSAIKPLIVYTPAFERNYTPNSVVVDEYTKSGPKNSGNSYSGKIKLQKAIEESKNTIAWKLFEELTPKVGLSYLKNMNFAKISYKDNVPAASLGGFTNGVSPIEMAAAYATLENDGYYREPNCIVAISDSEGNIIVEDITTDKQIYQTKAARIMTEALTGVITKGTAKGLGLSHTVSAGKTGTTNDKKDGWFVGYTPYYTTSVWVGYDLPRPVENLKGATYPGTIWHSFMEQLHTSSMTRQFEYYDWRADLKKPQKKEAAENTPLPQEDTMAIENEELSENTDISDENSDDEEDSIEQENPEAQEFEDGEDIEAEDSDNGDTAEDSEEDIIEDTNEDIIEDPTEDSDTEDSQDVTDGEEEAIGDGTITDDAVAGNMDEEAETGTFADE